MEGYDKNEAAGRFAKSIDKTGLEGMPQGKLESLIKMAIDLDFEYMEENRVLGGGGYYDDDDAYEFIVDNLIRVTGCGEDEQMQIARLVDGFMDCQQDYMTEKGLLGWED